jgi:hypothetical protein
MSETTAQANHELLLGLSQDMKIITHALGTMSQQLLDLTMTIGPALGMCGSCAAAWIAAGEDPETIIAAAMTVVVDPRAGVVPVCMWHFREACKPQESSRLLLAQPGVPQTPGTGSIVPGR